MNSMEFSQITARFPYPRHVKAELSTLHADVIAYVTTIYDGSHDLRTKTIRLLNTITRYIIDGDTFPENWSSTKSPFDNIEIEDALILKDQLNSLYIDPRSVNWDIQIVTANSGVTKSSTTSSVPLVPNTKITTKSSTTKVKLFQETDKRDLYIQPPTVPQFDINKPWMSTVIDGTVYCIYTSIPEIPTKQNEISVSTDVNRMSESQLLNLYPSNFIRTRPPVMYEPRPEFSYHPKLGLILPIEGFSESDLIDNIVKYPHLFKLFKVKDNEAISFYTTIEINGELYNIADVWKELPDTSIIPYTADFVKEYIVRRYLLERDIKGVEHKYPMYGDLNPYLTLFTSAPEYVQMGYTNVVDMARQCVESRVAYKRSRNPVIRRIENNV